MAGAETAMMVSVIISAVDRLTSPTRRMAEQMARLRSQTNMTESQLAQLESRMKSFKNMTMVGAGITLMGAGMADGLLKAADAAGKLQSSMLNVQSALKLNNQELEKATNLSQTVGIPTMWSAEQMGQIMQTMGNSGLNKSQVLNPQMLKAYASFAEVQNRKNGTDPTESVAAAVGMAHQYQLYGTKQINPFLNRLNAALLHTNSSPGEFSTTFKYISQQARNMGMNANQSLAATAWLDRMGFGNGRGGTNFADFLMRSIYGSSGKKADQAMVTAGFVKNGHSVFENNKGQFVGIQKASQILQDFSARFGNNTNKTSPLLHAIFGTQGGRIAQMMMSKGASEQYTNVQKQMGATASIGTTQERLNKSWEGQSNQFKTTLKDIQQNFGRSLIGLFLPVLQNLNKLLAKVLEFSQTHKKLTGFIAAFAAIAAAVLLIIGPIMTLVGIFGFLFTSGIVTSGIAAVGSAFAALLLPITIIVGVIALLYVAWKHNWGGIQQVTHAAIQSVVKTVQGAMKQFMAWWKTVWPEIKQVATEVWPYIKSFIDASMKIIFAIIKVAWTLIKDIIQITWTYISGYIKVGLDILTGHWGKAWTDWKTMIATIWPQIKKLFIDGWNGILAIGAQWGADAERLGSSIVTGIWNGIKALGTWLRNNVASFLSSFLPAPILHMIGLGSSGGYSTPPVNNSNSGSTTVHIHVNGSSNPKATAHEVVRQLGGVARTNNMSRSLGPNPLIYNGG